MTKWTEAKNHVLEASHALSYQKLSKRVSEVVYDTIRARIWCPVEYSTWDAVETIFGDISSDTNK